MKLSVIIPIYKTEIFLEDCVNSILSQSTEEIEIVLVDDGSPDNCPKMCDDIAKSNDNVLVVHKENGGLSSARNAGLAVATGKYVTFVDSDDLITSSSIRDVLNWINTDDADVCFLGAEKLFSDGRKSDLGESIDRDVIHSCTKEEAIAYLSTRPKYPGSAWSKLFKREFLVENDLHFPYDRRYSEDLGFILDCLRKAKKIDALNTHFYQYRQGREGSITNKVSIKNFNDLYRFIEESVPKLTNGKKPLDSVCKDLMSFVAYEYTVLLHLYRSIDKECKKDAIKKLKESKWTLRFANNKKTKLVYVFAMLFGLRITSFATHKYRRISQK